MNRRGFLASLGASTVLASPAKASGFLLNSFWFGAGASAFSGALIYRTTNTASLGAGTDIPFQSEVYDTANYFVVGTSAVNFVIPATGLYRFQFNFSTDSLANYDATKSYKNGTTNIIGGHAAGAAGNSNHTFGVGASGVISLNAADTVKSQSAFGGNSPKYGYNNDSTDTWTSVEQLDPNTKYALAYTSTNLSITTANGWNTLHYDSNVADTSSIHNTVTNNSRMTVPSGFSSRVRLSWGIVTTNATFNFACTCAKNGTPNFHGAPTNSRGGGGNKVISMMGPPINVSAGDYFEHVFYPGATTTVDNDPYTFFCLESVPSTIIACVAYNNAAQTVTSTYADILFNSNDYDDASIHSTSTNTNRFVVPAGVTMARFHFGSNATSTPAGIVMARSKKNGTYVTGGTAVTSDISTFGWHGISTPWLPVTAGDYFTVEMSVISGSFTIGAGTWAALECQ